MRLVFRSDEPALEVFEERFADAISRSALDERDDEQGNPGDADDYEEITPQSGAQKRATPLLK